MMKTVYLIAVLIYSVGAQLDPNPSYPPHGCMNYGLCMQTPSPNISVLTCASGECFCLPGTTGDMCEEMIDLCVNNPCTPDQDCTSSFNEYTCVCKAGYTGADCTTEMASICATEPCLNGGTCLDEGDGNYTCTCPDNYKEPNCQYQDRCANNPCQNGAECIAIWDYQDYYCECPDGYTGKNCGWSRVTFDTSQKTLVSCYVYNDVLEDSSKYLKWTDPAMTADKCMNFQMASVNPIYKYYTLFGTSCYVSEENYITEGALNYDTDMTCQGTCPGDKKQYCGNTNKWFQRVLVIENDNITIDENQCETNSGNETARCNVTSGYGMCIDTQARNQAPPDYLCLCRAPFTGSLTHDCTPPVDPCNPNPCKRNGTCVSDDNGNYECICKSPYGGDNCQYRLPCYNNPCQNGGTCNDNGDGTYSCECLPYYSETNCTEINICEYANPCVHGSCTDRGTNIQIYPKCKCDPGWTGKYCDTEKNFCNGVNPCKHNDTCIPSFNDYTCVCTLGYTGKDCEINIDDCTPYTDANGVVYKNRCTTKDENAICIDGVNSFTCNCTENWTMEYCDLHVVIRDVLLTIYGEVNTLLIPLLEDLMNSPAMIKEMVPFIIGTLDAENRSALSWTADDLFNWIDFEEYRLDPNTDLVVWNDVVLGNCFTFNRFNSKFFYKMRSSSKKYGFYTQMRVRQDELLPWYETAAMMVFVHNVDESIFSESVRYNAESNSEVNLYVEDTHYTRLSGKYGRCVRKPSEVKAYYYQGMYTTDGCLRSCYQDMIERHCGCMDPRYPMKEDSSSCKILDMSCIDEATTAEGDPSTWDSCVCPLPCENQQYTVMWDKSSYVSQIPSCEAAKDKDKCETDVRDSVQIQVSLPSLTYSLYAETPKMDLNKFIANLGGLLGVLMGISIISFIEFAILVIYLIKVVISNKL